DAWWSLLYEEVQDSRGLSSLNAKDLQTAYIRVFIRRRLDADATRPERAPAWLYCCVESEGNVGGQPEAAAFFDYPIGATADLCVVGNPVRAIVVIGTGGEILVEEIVDGGVERQVLRGFIRASQVENFVSLEVACCVHYLLVGVRQGCITLIETGAFATVFTLEPQVQLVGCLPAQTSESHVHRSVG